MAQDGPGPTELTATQFVVLAENQRKKKALAETKSQFAKVADVNRSLTLQLEETQQESYEVTEHLRRELLDKTQKIVDLQNQLAKSQEDQAAEVKRLEELASQREANILEDASAHAAQLQAKIDELQNTLTSVGEFRSRQVEVEEELMRVKEENQELRERLEAQRSELERYYLELNTKQRKEWEQRLEELKKAAEEEVDERLDASVKRILQQNRRMAEELKIHVQETDVLQQEVKILEEERTRLMREVALKAELEEGYAKRGAMQAGSLKASNVKIATLEGTIAQLMSDFERERQSVLRSTATQVEEARAETEALRRLIKLKTKELKNVRRLAQEVLLQRSDVETFLLSSLHHVRKEAERESVLGAHHAAQGQHSTQQGSYQQQQTGSDGAVGTSGRLDIRDLPWEDRERVLRLLFAKINNQAQQMFFSNLPQHPLETGVQAVKGTSTGGLGSAAMSDAMA